MLRWFRGHGRILWIWIGVIGVQALDAQVQLIADEPDFVSIYRPSNRCFVRPIYRTLQVSPQTEENAIILSGYHLLSSEEVLGEIRVPSPARPGILEAVKSHTRVTTRAFGNIQSKPLNEKFFRERSQDLRDEEDRIRSQLSVEQIERLNQIAQYLALRHGGAEYFILSLASRDDRIDRIHFPVVLEREIELKNAAYQRARPIWLKALDNIENLLSSQQREVHDWWRERRGSFEGSIYADLVCQYASTDSFGEFLGEPIHEIGFPEIFSNSLQLQSEVDGRWSLKIFRDMPLLSNFDFLVGTFRFQQTYYGENELDLSLEQVEALNKVGGLVYAEAYAIPDLKESQFKEIELKHVADAWNDILLPRQRDFFVELIRGQYRTMAGPLEVLFRPELEDKTKEAIRKEFESCRKQLLEIEAQLMSDLLSVLKKELDLPNLITGQARPKYLQPSLCLLELHLIKHGRLPQQKSEIE